jgi:hypothetical protein
MFLKNWTRENISKLLIQTLKLCSSVVCSTSAVSPPPPKNISQCNIFMNVAQKKGEDYKSTARIEVLLENLIIMQPNKISYISHELYIPCLSHPH